MALKLSQQSCTELCHQKAHSYLLSKNNFEPHKNAGGQYFTDEEAEV